MNVANLFVTTGIFALLSHVPAVVAQDFPSKTVRIVASEAGGGGDFIARLLAVGLTSAFGQQVIVENRGGGVVAGDVVARAAPDGYMLTMGTIGAMSVNMSLFKSVPYDSTRDFAPITLTGNVENLLVVHPSVPVRGVKDLIALAASKPGMLIFASSGTGTAPYLTM